MGVETLSACLKSNLAGEILKAIMLDCSLAKELTGIGELSRLMTLSANESSKKAMKIQGQIINPVQTNS